MAGGSSLDVFAMYFVALTVTSLVGERLLRSLLVVRCVTRRIEAAHVPGAIGSR